LEITYVSQSARELIPDHVTIVFPGYNIFQAVDLGLAYAQASDRKDGMTVADFGSVAVISYDNYELDNDELADTVNDFVTSQGYKKVTTIGSSTGGKMAAHSVDTLLRAGKKANFGLDGAPYSSGQVIGPNRDFVRFLAYLKDINAPIDGPIVRLGIETIQRLGSGLDLSEALGRAKTKISPENCSTDLIGDQSQVIVDDNLDEICTRIGMHAPAAYTVAAQNSLVDEPAAAIEWKLKLKQKDMKVIKGKNTQHASPGSNPREYGRNWLSIYQGHFKLKSVFEIAGYKDDTAAMNDKGQLTHEPQDPGILQIFKP
ncbi:MAG TPA: hypothetical protein VH144_03850, partial [Candidatus Saccharimonadales bacterium]|nr:hypothetical protein [Candidatus Saccharimonadales bacterium]